MAGKRLILSILTFNVLDSGLGHTDSELQGSKRVPNLVFTLFFVNVILTCCCHSEAHRSKTAADGTEAQ
jgi:hypothetical protein